MTQAESSFEFAYSTLRKKAIDFEFKPGERLNESALTRQLAISRTPLREALNRLVAEGFLTFELGRGFFCRPLSPQKIQDLYQIRSALETEALVRTIDCASDDAVKEVLLYLDQAEQVYVQCSDLNELLRMDEEFHMKLAALSNNEELVHLLDNINERIRYVRIINLRLLRDHRDSPDYKKSSLFSHRAVLESIRDRDEKKAVAKLRSHIEQRSEQTIELVRVAFSQLYVPDV